MGALLSICFKSRGDDAHVNSQIQAKKHKQAQQQQNKMTKQKSAQKPFLSVDTGRANSPGGGYNSFNQTSQPGIERQSSWGRKSQSSDQKSPTGSPRPPPSPHQKPKEDKKGIGRTLSLKVASSDPSTASKKRGSFRKKGRKK